MYICLCLSGYRTRRFGFSARCEGDAQEREDGFLGRGEEVAGDELDCFDVRLGRDVLANGETSCGDLVRGQRVERVPCGEGHGGGEGERCWNVCLRALIYSRRGEDRNPA